MRAILWKYLGIFKKMYPTHPSPETWDVYERVLADLDDLQLAAACEICVGELSFFPMAAQIRERVKVAEKYQGTSTFDLSADFVPAEQWYERHLKTHDVLIVMDKYGRKKVKQVLISANREYKNWPAHWNAENAPAMTWEEARKKIAQIGKSKTL